MSFVNIIYLANFPSFYSRGTRARKWKHLLVRRLERVSSMNRTCRLNRTKTIKLEILILEIVFICFLFMEGRNKNCYFDFICLFVGVIANFGFFCKAEHYLLLMIISSSFVDHEYCNYFLLQFFLKRKFLNPYKLTCIWAIFRQIQTIQYTFYIFQASCHT